MNFLKLSILCGAIVMAAGTGSAQERAAGGTMDTQMTWTALSDMAKAATDKAAAVNSRVDQVVVCGKNGRVYSTNVTGADGSGCMEAKAADGTTITAINNTVKNVGTSVTNIITCNQQNKLYNGTTCTDLPQPDKDESKMFPVDTGGWKTGNVVMKCPGKLNFINASGNATSKNSQAPCGVGSSNCDHERSDCIGKNSCSTATGSWYSMWGTCI